LSAASYGRSPVPCPWPRIGQHGRLKTRPSGQLRLARTVDPQAIFGPHQVNLLSSQRHPAATHLGWSTRDVELSGARNAAPPLQWAPPNANRPLAWLGRPRFIQRHVAADHEVFKFHLLALADHLHLNQV